MTDSRGTQQQVVSHANGSVSGRGLSNSQDLNTFPDTDIEEFHFSSTKDKKLTTENEVNPELLHVNSAVFEEGSMPKAIFSTKPIFQNKLNDVMPADIQFVSLA